MRNYLMLSLFFSGFSTWTRTRDLRINALLRDPTKRETLPNITQYHAGRRIRQTANSKVNLMDMQKKATIVPALPGFFQLSPLEGDGGSIAELWEDPIIAWRIVEEPYHESANRRPDEFIVFVEAITTDGIDERDECAILRPDGKVTSEHIGAWDSKAEFLKFLVEERAQRRKAA